MRRVIVVALSLLVVLGIFSIPNIAWATSSFEHSGRHTGWYTQQSGERNGWYNPNRDYFNKSGNGIPPWYPMFQPENLTG